VPEAGGTDPAGAGAGQLIGAMLKVMTAADVVGAGVDTGGLDVVGAGEDVVGGADVVVAGGADVVGADVVTGGALVVGVDGLQATIPKTNDKATRRQMMIEYLFVLKTFSS
jgi:hypothetical protein